MGFYGIGCEEIVAINNNHHNPLTFKLYKPYPNPFNPITTIRFSVETMHATFLRIYDITGRLVEDLVNDELVSGAHEIIWNASLLPSGVYFVRLQNGDQVETQKLILLK